MEISTPNEFGVLPARSVEVVARIGRANAEVRIAFCEDGLYRQSVGFSYSYGGYGSPIREDDPGYPTFDAARTAGLEELLRRCPTAHWWEPQNAQDETVELRRQIEARLRQPSLF